MSRHPDIRGVAELLEQCSQVARFDAPGDPEAWALADALVDIVDSCKRVHGDLMPTLLAAQEGKTIEEALHDIGEELRHILYHIRASRFFKYLDEPTS